MQLHQTLRGIWRRMLWAGNSGMVWGGGIALGITAAVYALVEPLKADTVIHSVDMTTRVMREEQFQSDLLGLSRKVVSGLLQDASSVELLTDLVKRLAAHKDMDPILPSLVHVLLKDPRNEESVRIFVSDLLEDEEVLAAVRGLGAKVVVELSGHPELQTRGMQYLVGALAEAVLTPSVQDSASDAMPSILAVALSIKGKPLNFDSLKASNNDLQEQLNEIEASIADLKQRCDHPV